MPSSQRHHFPPNASRKHFAEREIHSASVRFFTARGQREETRHDAGQRRI
jgi:hypothetical protein